MDIPVVTVDLTDLKKCTHCGRFLPKTEYSKNKNGLQSWCKKCTNEATKMRNKQRYHDDPAYRDKVLRAKNAKYYEERARAIANNTEGPRLRELVRLTQGVDIRYGEDVNDD